MPLDDIPNKLESVWIQRNTENQFYEQVNVSGSDLIVYHSSSGEIQADKISVWASRYGLSGGSTVKVSSTDTTSGYLSGSKLLPGNNVSFSIESPGGNESLVIHSTGGGTSNSASWASSSLSSSYMFFNGNRGITRAPYNGINVGTDNVVNFLDQFFFPFVSAAISINGGTTYYETGSSQTISVNGSITANSETIFGSGSVRRNGLDWYTFTSASSYSTSDTGVTESSTYKTFMQVGNNGSPAFITSSTKTATFIYPYLWGMSTVAGLSGVALYTTMSVKTIAVQGTKSDSFVGTSTYIYFCYPSSYTNLSSIKDPNNFEILGSFEFSASVPVTSSGLTNNWMNTYKVYRLILQANPNGTYTFTHS